MIYNVIDYGAIADGKTLSTNAIQKAIDQCSLNKGEKVLIPNGKFLCGSVVLKDDVHICFEKGATLLGVKVSEFDKDEEQPPIRYQDLSHTTYNVSMFRGIGLKNITFSGYGVIDMQSEWDVEEKRDQSNVGRGAKVFALKECSNVVIKDLTLLNATDLCVYLAGCKNVLTTNLKIKVYVDGISPDACKNVTIIHCDIDSGDDAVVIKSSYTLGRVESCENIIVDNCIIKSRCSALKIGTETNGDIKNVKITNCKVYDTNSEGIAIEIADGGNMDGVFVDNIDMENISIPLFVFLGNRNRGPNATDGSMKNVTISNVNVRGNYKPYQAMYSNYKKAKIFDTYQEPWREPWVDISNSKDNVQPEILPWQTTSSVTGIKDNPITNLTLKNISLDLSGGAKEKDYDFDVPELREKGPSGRMFLMHLPAKAIYFRHVKNLMLENINVKYQHDDVREEFVFDDVTKI